MHSKLIVYQVKSDNLITAGQSCNKMARVNRWENIRVSVQAFVKQSRGFTVMQIPSLFERLSYYEKSRLPVLPRLVLGCEKRSILFRNRSVFWFDNKSSLFDENASLFDDKLPTFPRLEKSGLENPKNMR